MSHLPKSIYQGVWTVDDVSVDCHVLDTQDHVITQRGVYALLIGGPKQGKFHRYIERIPRENNTLRAVPIRFVAKGVVANGYTAEDINDICWAYLDAERADKLRKDQLHIATKAFRVVKEAGREGLRSLIAEVTGWQDVRAKNEVQIRMSYLLRDEPREWEKTYPDEIWKEAARLVKIPWKKGMNTTALAPVIRDYIYIAIAGKEVYEELKRRCPKPQFRNNLHQWFQENSALPEIHRRIGEVLSLMKTSTTWSSFKRKLENREQYLLFDEDLNSKIA